MPSRPCSVVSSTKSITVSVSGFWRPVRTLASLTGLASGSTTWDSLTLRMRSPVVGVAVGGTRVCVIGVPRVVGLTCMMSVQLITQVRQAPPVRSRSEPGQQPSTGPPLAGPRAVPAAPAGRARCRTTSPRALPVGRRRRAAGPPPRAGRGLGLRRRRLRLRARDAPQRRRLRPRRAHADGLRPGRRARHHRHPAGSHRGSADRPRADRLHAAEPPHRRARRGRRGREGRPALHAVDLRHDLDHRCRARGAGRPQLVPGLPDEGPRRDPGAPRRGARGRATRRWCSPSTRPSPA